MSGRAATDERYMRLAVELAREAASHGDVPVGALLVCAGRIVSRAANRVERDRDPTAHAELLCLREAALRAGTPTTEGGGTLYVTLEPCAMCAGAIVLARIDRLVFGAWDPKAGMVGSLHDLVRHPRLNHQPEVAAGILADDCGYLLRAFFLAKRAAS